MYYINSRSTVVCWLNENISGRKLNFESSIFKFQGGKDAYVNSQLQGCLSLSDLTPFHFQPLWLQNTMEAWSTQKHFSTGKMGLLGFVFAT